MTLRPVLAGLALASLCGLATLWPRVDSAPPPPPELPGRRFLDGPIAARADSGEKLDLRSPIDGASVVLFADDDGPAVEAVAALAKAHPARRLRAFVVGGGGSSRADIPRIADPRGDLARRFRAGGEPEAFVLVGGGRLFYRGPAGEPLNHAVEAALEGREAGPSPVAPSGTPPSVAGPAPTPTYNQDVGPILHRSCLACHAPGMSAPFPLLTYAQAAKRAGDLADVAESGAMPPWAPEPGVGPPLLHDRTLLASEVATLRAWADAGAPEGPGPSPSPSPPDPSAWRLGPPDLVLEMPEAFEVPASGPDVYRCFVLPTSLPADRFLAAVEVRPGNPRVVHHVFNYLDVRGLGRSRDREAPGPGYPCMSGFTGDSIFGAMGGWTPGNEPVRYGEGIGLNLPKGSDVVMQVHYHPSGKPESDRTRLGLYFAKGPVRQSLQWLSACADPATFALPAGEPEARVRAELTVPMDVDLHAITPHMHLLGRELRASVELPDGRIRPLIAVRDWDFDRQDTYTLREPLRLPAGTVVRLEGVYDNSEANPRNPSRPPRPVRWGEGTNDDMLILFLALTRPDQDLTAPGVTDDFMEEFFRRAQDGATGR